MLNKICLIGNLGTDPESKEVGDTTIVKFSVATTEKVKGADETTWHNIIAFGKTGELCEQYLKKGSKVYLEGKQQHKNYTDKEGVKKYYSEVLLREVKFLSPIKKDEEQEEDYRPMITPLDEPASPQPDNDLPF